MTTRASFKFNPRQFDEFAERILAAGRDIDAVADEALIAAALVLQAGMVERVPIDTGNLKDHIKIKGPFRRGNFHQIEVGVIHDINYTDADTARYGNVQEYGSATTPPHPYIRPAIDEDSRYARSAMREVFEDHYGGLMEKSNG